MAEKVHYSSDIPNFDTYPAPSPIGESERLLESGRGSSLEQRAAELGTAAGKVVVMARQAREALAKLPRHRVLDPISDLAETTRIHAENLGKIAAHKTVEWTDAAREKTLELRNEAREKAAELGRQAKSNYYRARIRANQVVREYPVHVALAAGAVGFLVGVALRIRRANRAY
ncbi:MAG: hypothetical protein WA738_04580 [Candidatus Angelobacter sp.]